MKTKFSLRAPWLPAHLMWILLVSQCAWHPSALAQTITKEAMLRDTVRQVIAPSYQDLGGKCQALTVAAEQLAKAPTAESLEKTRQAWLAVLLSACQIQWLQSGPIADRESLANFYYTKVMPFRIEGVLNSGRALDEAYLDELAATAKGLFALEYLLFEERSESAANASTNSTPDPRIFFGTNVQRRCQFLLAVANDLRTKAATVSADWASTNRTDAAAKFTAGGQTTLNTTVNELARILELVAEQRLNFALLLPAPVMRQLDRIEGARSRTSLPQLVAILRGAHQAYRGGEGIGIDDYLRTLNRTLESRVEQQFQKAIAAMQAIDLPLEVAVTDRKELVQRAYEAVHELEILFKVDVASVLGVTITINSNDGD